MRKLILCCSSVLFLAFGYSQTDTTIYKVVEEMPRFPACEALDTTLEAKLQCANLAMLQYVYQRIIYPQEAIQENIQGTAVITFVVEKDGSTSQPQIVRDLGGGTGLAALGVVLRMQEEEIKWVPGRRGGQQVRVQFNLPVRFKLEDPSPFVLVGRDTVYTIYDTALDFVGGAEALQAYLDTALNYPEMGNIKCQMGQIDIQVLVENTGNVRVLDITDFSDLGFDFWYASIDAATATYGKWKPAVYQGRCVNAAFDLSLSFMPTSESCTSEIYRYVAARETANAGATLFNEGQIETGLRQLTEAVDAFPGDAQLLIMRGQAYLSNNQFAEACADLSLARRIALIPWFDSVLPLICK